MAFLGIEGFWAFLIIALLALITLGYLVLWIVMLIDSFKRKKWIWFILMLFSNFSAITTIIYTLTEYKKGKLR